MAQKMLSKDAGEAGQRRETRQENSSARTGKRWQISAVSVVIFPSHRPFQHQKPALPRSQEQRFQTNLH